MLTFIKAQAVSLTASIMDFLMMVTLVEVFHVWYLRAAILGTLTGGITYFVLARSWAFAAKNGDVTVQVARYIIIWAGYLILNAAGVYWATQYLGLHYTLSKVVISLVLGVTYNYFFQKNFVFK